MSLICEKPKSSNTKNHEEDVWSIVTAASTIVGAGDDFIPNELGDREGRVRWIHAAEDVLGSVRYVVGISNPGSESESEELIHQPVVGLQAMGLPILNLAKAVIIHEAQVVLMRDSLTVQVKVSDILWRQAKKASKGYKSNTDC